MRDIDIHTAQENLLYWSSTFAPARVNSQPMRTHSPSSERPPLKPFCHLGKTKHLAFDDERTPECWTRIFPICLLGFFYQSKSKTGKVMFVRKINFCFISYRIVLFKSVCGATYRTQENTPYPFLDFKVTVYPAGTIAI